MVDHTTYVEATGDDAPGQTLKKLLLGANTEQPGEDGYFASPDLAKVMAEDHTVEGLAC